MQLPIREVISRSITYPISALITAVTSWLIINEAGVSSLADFSAIAGFIALMTFLDFGGGARVVGVAGSFKVTADMEKLKSGISAAISFQLMISCFLVVPALLLFYFQNQIVIPYVATVFLLNLASMPFSIVAKTLIGLGQSARWYWIQVLASSIALALCWIFSLVGNIEAIVLLPVLISILPNLICTKLVLRELNIPLRSLLANIFAGAQLSTFFQSYSVQRNFALISLFTAVTYASDRVIITLLGSKEDLATFTLTSQVFNSGFSILAAAGLGVWGHLASLSDRGIVAYRLRNSALFSLLGFSLSVLLVICVPVYFHFVASGALTIDWRAVLFFSLFLVAQAFQYPMGYFMLHNKGDKSQMVFLLIACLLKFPLVLLLTPVLGMSGVVFSSFLIVVLAQIGPGLLTLRARGSISW